MKHKILFAIAILVLISLGIGTKFYLNYFSSNTNFEKNSVYLFIPTGATFQQVLDSIQQHKIIKNTNTFVNWAEQRKYTSKIKPGRYRVKNGMSNYELVRKLRVGDQDPVNLTFNKFRDKKVLAEAVAKKLECKSEELLQLLSDNAFLSKNGLTQETVMGIIIPNTYAFNWNTSPEDFFARMKKEFDDFWNKDRNEKLKKYNLTPMQAVTLASIVDEETNKDDEKPRIAGVYLNRLRENWNLGADPTVKFAVGDFTLRRILNEHLEVNSPYNTYKNVGLPPGPICTPMISSIDAVLNAEAHDYMFFCAKDDMSGYHAFAKTSEEHAQNAVRFQTALNKMKIFK